jgi:hypothetical protein
VPRPRLCSFQSSWTFAENTRARLQASLCR